MVVRERICDEIIIPIKHSDFLLQCLLMQVETLLEAVTVLDIFTYESLPMQ